MRLVHRLSPLYTVDILSYWVHIVLYAPSELPRVEDGIARNNNYYEGKKGIHEDSPELEAVRARLRDS